MPAAIISEYISDAGAEPVIYTTTAKGDGMELARKAFYDGAARIYPAGGDGTLNEAVTGLMSLVDEKKAVPSRLPVVCPIPLGTVNVFSKEMGFPENPCDALLASFSASEKTVDIGRCADRYFILMASAGFDGFVVSELEKMLSERSSVKKIFGPFAYIVVGLRSLFKYGFPKMKVTARSVFGKKEFSAEFILISNSKYYGGKYILNPKTDIGDGFLDLFLFNSRSVFDYFRMLFRVLSKSSDFSGLDVVTLKAKGCSVEYIDSSKGPTYSQVDGEIYVEPPFEADIREKVLKILYCG